MLTRKLSPIIAVPFTVLLLAGCGGGEGSTDPASSGAASPAATAEAGGTLQSLNDVPTAAKQGEWAEAGTVTTATSETDMTAIEINSFIKQAENGGTITIAVPVDGTSPGYQMEASMKDDNYYTKYVTGEGVSFASGNGTQWCVTDIIQTDTPTAEDWACQTGRPEGGNEFEQIAGYGWLPLAPSSILSENVSNVQASEGMVETNGEATRITYDVNGEKIVITYSPSNGWVYAEQPGSGEPFSYIYSPDVPEFPALPALAADTTDTSTNSAAPQPDGE